jgi:hypothetical protein
MAAPWQDAPVAERLAGRMFTTHDRAGEARISSRLGLSHDAVEVDAGFDFWTYVVEELARADGSTT